MLPKNRTLWGLINIGPTIAARLSEVGISTVGDLRRVGVAKAFQMVRANNTDKHIPVCYYLYSLQGALESVHWDALSKQTKRKLTREAGILVEMKCPSRSRVGRSAP
jgi:DNA transformation protein and related proteins